MMDPRLIVITDRGLAAPRGIADVVLAVLRAGARTIQLRDKHASARELYAAAVELLPLVHGHGGVLIVNDRLDVALAAHADGVHLGPDDLPVATARRIAPPDFIVGASTDDPARAARLEADGATYLGCGAVFGTRTKDVGDERVGPERVAAVAAAVRIPVIAIGGLNPENAGALRGTGARGLAVVSALMTAPDPAPVVARLLSALD